ncbi:MAG: peptidoglycan editing factor PgeF [bacterium]
MKPHGIMRKRGGITYISFSHFEENGGVLAAFTTRLGGFSATPYDTLNVGLFCGDKPYHVQENRRKIESALAVSLRDRVLIVHGNQILVAERELRNDELPEGDAILTCLPGYSLSMTFADCVPVYLYDPDWKAIALVHAGWRGTLAGISALAVERMICEYGSAPGRILAAIGPSIGPCCFMVDAEVASRFSEKFPYGQDLIHGMANISSKEQDEGDGTSPSRNCTYIDLWDANRRQLVESGIHDENIAVSGFCTSCRKDLFFSYRRDGRTSGRMAAIMSINKKVDKDA